MGESHKISSFLRQFSTISCTIIAAVVEQIVESGDTDFVQKSYNCLLSFLFMYMYVCIKIIVVFWILLVRQLKELVASWIEFRTCPCTKAERDEI